MKSSNWWPSFLRRSERAAALLALAVALATAASAETAPWHEISLTIDPRTRALEARDTLSFDSARKATLLLAPQFQIKSLAADGRALEPRAETAAGLMRIELPAARRIDLSWSGTLAALERNVEHVQTLSAGAPASGPEGTFLPAGSGWYPAVEGTLERYRVEIDLPADQRGLAPGRLLEEREAGERYRARFEFSHPSEGITLIAGPYRIEERQVRTAAGSEVRLRTYFHAEIAALASGYLDAITGYLDLYERWIGAYPFSEFSVVSSPTPTGFGMPSLTYLGIEVLRLPFIRATSLGHEILHNWWGNGVYPDFSRGNWAEGLTNFMADYAYRERESAQGGAAVRLAWLRDYAAMPEKDDLPLVGFVSRRHGASQIVGYNKAAMLFFMLREAIGEPAFDEGVRRFWREHRFRVASWDDLRAAFERASDRDLAAFFDQWLDRPGAPELRMEAARAERLGARWRLRVTLAQRAPAYAFSVPLAISTTGGQFARRVEVSRVRESVEIDSDSEPIAVTLDPEHRLFRRLAPAEAPPILREVMLSADAEMLALSPDPGTQQAARSLASKLFERAPREITVALQPRAGVLVVVGLHSDIDAWLSRMGLPPRPAALGAERGSAQVWTQRVGNTRTIALVSARDAQSISALERPLPHYGQQSYLAFDGARNIERGIWPARPPVVNVTALPAR
ncbi:MAG: M1 family peptidase [Betaproteobacteria bacterium]|nr:M1 family peptidase [Betaproteobacteria bacterium]